MTQPCTCTVDVRNGVVIDREANCAEHSPARAEDFWLLFCDDYDGTLECPVDRCHWSRNINRGSDDTSLGALLAIARDHLAKDPRHVAQSTTQRADHV